MELCLIAKDAAVEGVKAELTSKRVGGFVKVLGVSRLKKEFREFQDRRALVARYDAFFCDDRVVTMMPKLCGKAFFARNKAPLPVRLDRGDMAAALARARDATWLRLGAQTVGLRVGRAHFSPAQLAANVAAAVPPAVEHFAKKWRGVASIHLRGVDTLALPVFKALATPAIEFGEGEEEEEGEEGEEGAGAGGGGGRKAQAAVAVAAAPVPAAKKVVGPGKKGGSSGGGGEAAHPPPPAAGAKRLRAEAGAAARALLPPPPAAPAAAALKKAAPATAPQKAALQAPVVAEAPAPPAAKAAKKAKTT